MIQIHIKTEIEKAARSNEEHCPDQQRSKQHRAVQRALNFEQCAADYDSIRRLRFIGHFACGGQLRGYPCRPGKILHIKTGIPVLVHRDNSAVQAVADHQSAEVPAASAVQLRKQVFGNGHMLRIANLLNPGSLLERVGCLEPRSGQAAVTLGTNHHQSLVALQRRLI
ncbi:hypothetical protein D3C73_842480 [compost metagenome]